MSGRRRSTSSEAEASASDRPLAKRHRPELQEGGSLFSSAPTPQKTLGKGKGKAKQQDSDEEPPTDDGDTEPSTDDEAASTIPALPPRKPTISILDLTTELTPPPPDLPPGALLAELTCPICLGSPTPLVVTACGHTFCGPCLHAALLAGPSLSPEPDRHAQRLFGPGGSLTFRAEGAAVSRAIAGDEDPRGEGEMDKRCPVCRVALYGGWGKSLRGLVMRMVPAPTAKA